ncbi:hypothetical protein Pint_00809 [Pistacia integerrima]|uniref:Uncharacterized protein n=1 Tax=Pistacia integerrima TaxID=434235 RepID=A0ACC0ZKD6_9ROSI|nr:hypothetical protein Pint_00809 [Pistacia integerrima]
MVSSNNGTVNHVNKSVVRRALHNADYAVMFSGQPQHLGLPTHINFPNSFPSQSDI